MQVSIGRQERALSEISAFVDQQSQFWDAAKPPRALYHYTSPEGLIGIVTTKAIWASDMLRQSPAWCALAAPAADASRPAAAAPGRPPRTGGFLQPGPRCASPPAFASEWERWAAFQITVYPHHYLELFLAEIPLFGIGGA
jgi:hypothetical protein